MKILQEKLKAETGANKVRVYNLVIAMLPSDETNFTANLQVLVDSLIAHMSDESFVILNTLMYVLDSDSPMCLEIYTKALTCAIHGGDFDRFRELFLKFDSLMRSWKVSAETKQSSLAALCTELFKTDDQKLALQVATVYLKSATSATPQIVEIASKAMRLCISTPGFYDLHTIHDLPVYAELPQSILREAFELLCSGDLVNFTKFSKKNSTDLTKLGLVEAQCIEKAQTLSFSQFCKQNLSQTIAYDEIAKALNIIADEVESHVMTAIYAGLVDGKLDQLNKTFVISRVSLQIFGDAEWTSLDGKFKQWRQSLDKVLGIVESLKSEIDTPPTAKMTSVGH